MKRLWDFLAAVFLLCVVGWVAMAAPDLSEFSPEEIETARKVEDTRIAKRYVSPEKNLRLEHTRKLLEGAQSTLTKVEPELHLEGNYARIRKHIEAALAEVERTQRLMTAVHAEKIAVKK